ncbi:hypothetical protein DIPPA_13519 [Diplonema papillatum]|nr:hypothetical protein DIPPA_13519 [Diplonema papillatum]
MGVVDWLTDEGSDDTAGKHRLYNQTRFAFDAFYAAFAVSNSYEVDDMCEAVENGTYPLDEILARLCKRFSNRGASLHDWSGPAARGVLKHRMECFYILYDPSCLYKVPDLVEHVASGRYPLTVVLNKMCSKYAAQGASLIEWVADYPDVLQNNTDLTKAFARRQMKGVGQSIVAEIDGEQVSGVVVSADPNSFTVAFSESETP